MIIGTKSGIIYQSGAIYITQEMVYIDVLDYTGWLFEPIAHQGC